MLKSVDLTDTVLAYSLKDCSGSRSLENPDAAWLRGRDLS